LQVYNSHIPSQQPPPPPEPYRAKVNPLVSSFSQGGVSSLLETPGWALFLLLPSINFLNSIN
jgi:hypothetical protein